jgi:hypothetical protein
VIEQIDIADEGAEAPILRAALEFFGGRYATPLRVGRFAIGRAQHLVDVLAGRRSVGDHLVLSGHGDERGFILPELAPDLEHLEAFHGALTPDDLRGLVDLPGRTVVSLGCMTGREEIASTFLAGGCDAYIGPSDYPDGSSAVFFALRLYYHLLHDDLELEEAFALATSTDAETRMYRLFR